MYIAYPKIIIACKKHAVSNKPPCKVQIFSISPLPRMSSPSNKLPCQISKLTISPRGLNRGFTVYNSDNIFSLFCKGPFTKDVRLKPGFVDPQPLLRLDKTIESHSNNNWTSGFRRLPFPGVSRMSFVNGPL